MNDASPIPPIREDAPAGLASELLESIGEILDALSAIEHGDLARRLEPRYEDTHPVGALALSVNAMVEALSEAKARSRSYQDELEVKLLAIERQQLAIHELSTPIIEVWKGVLCMPVIGFVDSQRAEEMTSALLEMLVEKRAKCAIVDITGIESMDAHVVDHFLRIGRTVRMLGARCVLSGVRPSISQTIVHMNAELRGFETHRTLRDALKQYVVQSAQDTGRKTSNRVVGTGSKRTERLREERK